MIHLSKLVIPWTSIILLQLVFFSHDCTAQVEQNIPCHDDPLFTFGSFTWKNKDKVERVVRTCAWMKQNPDLNERRVQKWCNYETKLGQVVKNKCAEACGECQALVAPGDAKCFNRPSNWKDQDGNSCDYYGKDAPGDCILGRDRRGISSLQACCGCQGGCVDKYVRPESSKANSPAVPWYDARGDGFTCEWYAKGSLTCRIYGGSYKNFGSPPRDACCVCGGGELRNQQ